MKDITSRGELVPPEVTVDLLLSNIQRNVAAGRKVLESETYLVGL